jgi:hypothetical protein
MGRLSEEELEVLRRRGLNEMIPAKSDDDEDDDAGDAGSGGTRRVRGRDVIEYKGREYEDMLQDGVIDVKAAPDASKPATQGGGT